MAKISPVSARPVRSAAASRHSHASVMRRRQFLQLTGAALVVRVLRRSHCSRSTRLHFEPCGALPTCGSAGLPVERGSGQAALFLRSAQRFQWRGAIERLSIERRCIADFMGLRYSRFRSTNRSRLMRRLRCSPRSLTRSRSARLISSPAIAVAPSLLFVSPSSQARALAAADELRRRTRQSAAEGEARNRNGARRHAGRSDREMAHRQGARPLDVRRSCLSRSQPFRR